MNKRRKPLDLEKLNKLRSDGVIGNIISSSDLEAIREYEIGKSPVDIAEEYGYCIRRNPVAAFAAVSGHGAERVAGVLGV